MSYLIPLTSILSPFFHGNNHILTISCSPFRFLELPAEIRNEIYLWCAIIIESSSTATVASSDLTLEQIKNEDVIRQPVITRLCHQTRVEGLPIFYQQRRFLFQTQHDPNVHAHAISWLNRIDRQLGHTIRHIDFFHDNDDPIQGVQLFINSANLDVLKGATARFHFSQASLSKLRDLLGFFLQHLTRGGRRTGDGRMEMIGRLCDARGRNLFVGIQPTLTSLVVEFYPR